MRKLLILATLPIALIGCFAEDDSEGGSTAGGSVVVPGKEPVSGSFTVEVDVVKIDREANEIWTSTVSKYCEDSVTLVTEVDTTMSTYTIADGKLTVTEEDDDCEAMQFLGASTDIVGSWTGGSYVALPEAPSYCAEEYSDDDVFKDMDMSVVVSETKIVQTLKYSEFCLADQFADAEEGFVKEDCSTVKMGMGQDTLTLKINKFTLSGEGAGASMTMTNSKGESCPIEMKEPMTSADCATGGEEEAMFTCMMQLMGMDPNQMEMETVEE